MIRLISAFCLLLAITGYAQTKPEYFYTSKGYGVSDGLSHGQVYKVLQDKKGFIWLATYHGLNRFDGYNFTNFYADRSDSNSMPDNRVTDMCTDEHGDIWLAYRSGDLTKYNSKTGTFSTFPVNRIKKSSDGMYLYTINTVNDGFVNYFFWNSPNLYRYNLHEEKFEVYPLPGSAASGDVVGAIEVMADTALVVISRKGEVYSFSFKRAQYTHITHYSRNSLYFTGKISFGRYIWGLDTAGVAMGYDLKTKQEIMLRGADGKPLMGVSDIYNSPKDRKHYIISGGNLFTAQQEIASAVIQKENPALWEHRNLINVFEDNAGNLWLGTMGMGVFVLHRRQQIFTTLKSMDKQLEVHSIRCIKNSGNRLFVSGYYGLDMVVNGSKKAIPLFRGENVYSVLPDPDDDSFLWYGQESFHSRLFKLNVKTGKSVDYYLLKDDGFPHTFYDIEADKTGNLWLAFDDRIIKFNRKTTETKSYLFSTNRAIPNQVTGIRQIAITPEGNIICATTGAGVVLFNPVTEKFTDSKTFIGADFPNVQIFSVLLRDSILWAGTNGLGLYRINLITKELKRLSREDGLPNNVVYGVVADKRGHLWASTNNGICRIIPEGFIFRNFDKADGLQDNEFNSGAFHIDEKGIVYFGGIFGLTYFDPSEMYENRVSVPVYLTQFKSLSTDAGLNAPAEVITELKIASADLPVQLRFSALNFFQSEKNQYAYRIIGISKTWNFVGNNRDIILANLDGGTYTLEVKASNNDGLWGEPLRMKIIVVPPFYLTGWFSVLLGVLFVAGAAGIMFYRIRSVEQQKQLLEELVSIRTREVDTRNSEITRQKNELEHLNKELVSANQAKDTFFSIIAHDLRSPVGAIIGYLGILDGDYEILDEQERRGFIADIRSISHSTMDLLDNLLQWSRMQSGSIVYRPEQLNMKQLGEKICVLFSAGSLQKNIEITNSIPEEAEAYADPNILFFIVRNLVSNAIKFTPQGGKVEIASKNLNGIPAVLISDTGTGITDEAVKAIFSESTHYSTPGTNHEPGTGLGLRISIAMAKLGGGKIEVKRLEGTGTEFTVYLAS